MNIAEMPGYLLFMFGHLYTVLALVIFALPHRNTKAAKQCYYIALSSAIFMAFIMFLLFKMKP